MPDRNISLQLLLTFAFAGLLASCSHEETVQSTTEKKYSPSTQKEFEEIEKGEVQKKTFPAFRDIDKTSGNKKHLQTTQPPLSAGLTQAQPSPSQTFQVPQLSNDSAISAKAKERMQEINQNLAYYCMKHRSDGAFSSEENCLKFTTKVLNACEKKHKLINTVMLNCIKKHLKKRR